MKIIRFFLNYLILFKNPISLTYSKRMSLLFTYTILLLKYALLYKLLDINLSSERIFGWKIYFFSYAAFFTLFQDIFIDNQYYFYTEKHNPLIIDGGANIGIEIFYFKWLYPSCEITAFEPDKKTFQLLKKSIKENHLNNTYIYQAALSDRKTKKKLYFSGKDPGSLVMSLSVRRYYQEFVWVKCERLSKFISSNVDFLVLDIEGEETRVISELSASKRIRLISQMIIEYHHHIDARINKLSELFHILEIADFGYQIQSKTMIPFKKEQFQDVLIYAYNKNK